MKPLEPATSAVPASRLSRPARLGSLASGVAGAMLAEGVRQLSQGKRPKIDDLLLTAPQAERNRLLSLLFALLFLELFDFHLIQTDPNFANYRYDTANGRLVLLDFWATRVYGKPMVAAYRRLLSAGMQEDMVAANIAATEIGYFQSDIQERLATVWAKPWLPASAVAAKV